jgi:hypothetical protein
MWSLTLRKEIMLRVLRRIFGCKRKEVTGQICIMNSFIFCVLHRVSLDLPCDKNEKAFFHQFTSPEIEDVLFRLVGSLVV